MTIKEVDGARLKYILTYGADQSELQEFLKLKKKPLIQAGEKVQNLPEYPAERIAVIVKFGAKASSIFERWFQENIEAHDIKPADEVVARFQQIEEAEVTLPDDEKRLLSRAVLFYLVQADTPDLLLSFMRSPIARPPQETGELEEDARSTPAGSSDVTSHAHFPTEDDLTTIAGAITGTEQSNTEAPGALSDLQRFALAIRYAREKDWDSLAEIEREVPESGLYKSVLEQALSSMKLDLPRGVDALPIRDITLPTEIDLNDVEVIAECTNIHPQGTSVFFEPLYLFDSNGLIRCTHKTYIELFPDTGQVMAFSNHLSRVPEVGSIGAWSVELRDTDRPVKVHIRSAADPIYEVFSIDVSSDDYDSVRAVLSAAKYADVGRALFQTVDGLLIRPRRDIADIARDGMKEIFDAWAALPGFVLRGRTFVLGPLPQPRIVYDCSPLDQVIQRVLAIGNDVENAPKLTKAEIRNVVEAANSATAKVDTSRIPDVRQHLDRHLQASASVQGIVDLVLQNPRIQREIQEAKANAAVQALSAREDLKLDIKRLLQERTGLEKAIRQREAEQQQLPAKIARAVRKAFTKAKTDGLDSLGDIAVIAQFLQLGQGGAKGTTEQVGPIGPELVWLPIATEGGSLEDVLGRYGVQHAYAEAIDRTVRVAAAAGLILILEGVAANSVADEIVRILSPKPAVSTTINIGVLGPELLREQILKLGDPLGAIVLKMANHSDIDSYGSELLDYSIKRIVEKKMDLPLLILTLSDGPSSLPTSRRLQRLAIRIDLDATGSFDAATGESNLRDIIEEVEASTNRKLWAPLRKRLNDSFDALAKDRASAVSQLIRTGFVDQALNSNDA
jgi:hypothetical protein